MFKTHKRIFIFLIVFVTVIILFIPTSYTISYFANKNTAFDKSNLKISEAPEDFDINFTFVSYKKATYNDDKTINDGRFRFLIEIKDFDRNVKNLQITYALDIDFGKVEYSSSNYKINNGNTIYATQDKTYNLTNYIISKTVYPVKPMPFITINDPNILVKITYTVEEKYTNLTVDKVCYLKITPKEYNKAVNNTTTTTTIPNTTTTTKKDEE